jgi:hypothetical protein
MTGGDGSRTPRRSIEFIGHKLPNVAGTASTALAEWGGSPKIWASSILGGMKSCILSVTTSRDSGPLAPLSQTLSQEINPIAVLFRKTATRANVFS